MDTDADVVPIVHQSHQQRLRQRTPRQRAIGAGHPFELGAADQILPTVVWRRQYPTHEVLAYLFGVSDSTVSRIIQRVLPILEQSGRDTMRLPDPGKKRRRSLDELLKDTPELAVVVDSFEQRVQRHKQPSEADKYCSGEKKQNTLKSQVAVDEHTGAVIDVSKSVYGPTADIELLKQSGLLERLPAGVGAIGDLAYLRMDQLHPQGLAAAPRRKPRGKPRPVEDVRYNRAFSRRRIIVEYTIGRMRRYQCLTQMDRQHRRDHQSRVIAVAGLVNRQIRHRFSA